jgi:AcrR family transcriptional regulator
MTTPKPRRKRSTYHHGDLARALVDEAVRSVVASGVESVTLREVARRVGVNHRAVYRHFEDKRALLVAVALEGNRDLLADLRAALAALPARARAAERLTAIAEAYARFAMARPGHYRVMFGPRLNHDGKYPALEAVLEEAWRELESLLAAGVATGELPPQDLLRSSLSIWAALHGVATLLLERRLRVRPARAPEFAAQLLAPLFRGLAVAPE